MEYDINERIKKIRNHYKLSQASFANRLGVSRGVIQNIDDKVTTPKPLIINLICKEFPIDPYWLETGNGDNMFLPEGKDDLIQNFLMDVLSEEEDAFKRRFIEMLANLDETGWIMLEKTIDSLSPKKKTEKEQD